MASWRETQVFEFRPLPLFTFRSLYWEFGIKPWDVAAGGLLVRELGGRAMSTEPDEKFLSTGTIVVSNGLLYEQMLGVLREGDGAPAKA